MYRMDYHLHSNYSFDGKEQLSAICDKAIAEGLQEIAITDHMDLYKEKPYGYILEFDKEYGELKEIQEQYKGRLTVRAGIELGQPQVNPKEAEKFLKEYPLDYIIGSVHNMENDIDVGEYDFNEVDGTQVFTSYLEWVSDLACNYEYDCIGHVTYPLRYMAKQGKRIRTDSFEEQVKELYRQIIHRGKGIELNTSGLYQEIKETMPSLKMLRWYKESGGEIITIGSDSHSVEHIGETFEAGMELLKAAGFRYVATYEGRVPRFHKIG